MPLMTTAHLVIGGATGSFAGIMPGVFEEVLYALEARKPLFIIGACGGASALLASRLAALAARDPSSPAPVIPSEFTRDHYREPAGRLDRVMAGLSHPSILRKPPEDAFARLWSHLSRVHDDESLATLLNNGLTGAENLELLRATAFGTICHAVWKGIRSLPAPPAPIGT